MDSIGVQKSDMNRPYRGRAEARRYPSHARHTPSTTRSPETVLVHNPAVAAIYDRRIFGPGESANIVRRYRKTAHQIKMAGPVADA